MRCLWISTHVEQLNLKLSTYQIAEGFNPFRILLDPSLGLIKLASVEKFSDRSLCPVRMLATSIGNRIYTYLDIVPDLGRTVQPDEVLLEAPHPSWLTPRFNIQDRGAETNERVPPFLWLGVFMSQSTRVDGAVTMVVIVAAVTMGRATAVSCWTVLVPRAAARGVVEVGVVTRKGCRSCDWARGVCHRSCWRGQQGWTGMKVRRGGGRKEFLSTAV